MVSLSYTILFSLASLVVASHKGKGSMRRRHVRARCNASGSHVNASGLPDPQNGEQAHASRLPHHSSGLSTQSTGLPTEASGLPTQASGLPTQASGLPTQASGLPTQASGRPTQTSNSTQASGQPAAKGGKYQLVDHYQGQDFMNEAHWSYFTGTDLTHGIVDFVSEATASAQGMVYVQNGAAVLSVNNKTNLPLNTKRQSVRLTSTKTYNAGLVVADFAAMPVGCSLWPAFWSFNVEKWPTAGEIDVIEGVNKQTTNEMTLHTGPQCSLDKSASFSGNAVSTDCETTSTSNAGCGISDPNPSSYGQGFNDIGGGVYARLWDKDGIKIWFFPRPSIPQDISSGNPDPSSWPTPVTFWSTSTCDVATHFYDHSLVIDTTLCGDWAGAVYGNSGCPGTCAQAVADASNFDHAYWMINSISTYV